MSAEPKNPTASCPSCGHRVSLEEILAHFEVQRGAGSVSADGGCSADGGGASGLGTLIHRCGLCKTRFPVTFRGVATRVIDRQMEELFGSIAQVLRGKATLN